VFLGALSGSWFFAWFVDAMVGANNRGDEDIVTIGPVSFPEPFDPAAKGQK
jgi:hypothetical protein